MDLNGQKRELTRAQAVKEFFGDKCPVSNTEIMTFIREDRVGWKALTDEVAGAMGVTLKESGQVVAIA